VKASEANKIKIRKVVDNTAAEVEIQVHLPPGVSPDLTMDALYAFTDCEISISPNTCVIIEDKPRFVGVEDMLRLSTQKTVRLLERELEIRQEELQGKWHSASLEKIFIENRIYRKIEECETWADILQTIDAGLRKFVRIEGEKLRANDTRLVLRRAITEEDLTRLTEIRIKRISKYDAFKAEEYIQKLEAELLEVADHLAHLTRYAISYFEGLLKKYGQNRERSIAGIRRVSKPGLRVYAKATALPKVLGGLGVAIISTSTGLLTDKQANKKGVGGEVLAYVW